MKTVMVVDDQTIVLQGIATLLKLSGKVDVLATAESGRQCLEQLSDGVLPDVILLDVQMPDLNGLETLKAIRKEHSIPVIFLTTFEDPFLCRQVAKNGAQGWLLKNVDVQVLINTIARVSNGEVLISGSQAASHERLTSRENEIARALVAGKTNQEIADAQCLSLGTVKNYTSNLFNKLDVRNRAEAIVRLKSLGLA
ncbi:response regulator transcription factor [Oleiphilus messinensis]|nr:response regulator transcription factor [Oleiphilus messinensis]